MPRSVCRLDRTPAGQQGGGLGRGGGHGRCRGRCRPARRREEPRTGREEETTAVRCGAGDVSGMMRRTSTADSGPAAARRRGDRRVGAEACTRGSRRGERESSARDEQRAQHQSRRRAREPQQGEILEVAARGQPAEIRAPLCRRKCVGEQSRDNFNQNGSETFTVCLDAYQTRST